MLYTFDQKYVVWHINLVQMTQVPKSLEEKAIAWVKENKKKIIQTIAGDTKFPSAESPISFFMAGSPGAGKTESALELAEVLNNELAIPTVRIDPDEIRTLIPYYTGKNTSIIKGASFVAVEKIYDHIIKKKKNAILDSTFTPYGKAEDNVRRALDKERKVYILYVYQDPLVAWRFTKERAKRDGRLVPKDFFIEALFESQENVQKIKDKYEGKVQVLAIKKDFEKGAKEYFDDVEKIDEIIKIDYNVSELKEKLV